MKKQAEDLPHSPVAMGGLWLAEPLRNKAPSPSPKLKYEAL